MKNTTRSVGALALIFAFLLVFALGAVYASPAPGAQAPATASAEETPAPDPTKKPTVFETAGKHLGFIGVCLFTTAALILAATAYERFVLKGIKKRVSRTRRITYIALFSGMAAVLMLFEIPLGFAPSFYKIDLSELPIMICTFFLGPVAGVIAEFIKVFLKVFLLKGTSTAFVGDFANFIIGCSFVLPASMIYHAKRSKKGALIGLIVGTLVMTVFGSLFNGIYLIPKYAKLYGMPIDVIVAMGTKVNRRITDVSTLVIYAAVPFNLIKGVLVSVITFIIYKPISKVLKLEFHKKKAE
ncbi:MAG: ECF transporter S component [Clostridia bacterium]|nr:ECF transporter S component [Clostridia bacterium]